MKKFTKTIFGVITFGCIGFSNITMAQVPVLIKDLYSGNSSGSPSNITESNNILFFSGYGGSSAVLFKTDGTSAGTVLVTKNYSAQYYPLDPLSLTDVNGVLFFSATDQSTGRELWKSDGTAAGTVLVKDINPSGEGITQSASFVNVNGTLYFLADNGTTGEELWKSDGTAAGTVLVKDVNPSLSGNYIQQLTALNRTLFFTANNGVNGQELWKSDGTTAGTVMVKDIAASGSGIAYNSDISKSELHVLNNILYFAANDGVNGLELWKSDGTALGTAIVKDIYTGSTSSLTGPRLYAFKNSVFFSATNGTKIGLWKSDGTSAGTVFIATCSSVGGWYYERNAGFASNANTLFFSCTNTLWKSDGTPTGTIMIKDVKPGNPTSMHSSLTIIGDTAYFIIRDSGIENQLWKSDGTALGNRNVSNGFCSPGGLISYKGALIFPGYNNQVGTELWKINEPTLGTNEANINITANLFPNPSNGKFICSSTQIFSEINIYNVSGENIYSEKFNANIKEIDLTLQPKGIYFYQLKGDTQILKTGKVIIE